MLVVNERRQQSQENSEKDRGNMRNKSLEASRTRVEQHKVGHQIKDVKAFTSQTITQVRARARGLLKQATCTFSHQKVLRQQWKQKYK